MIRTSFIGVIAATFLLSLASLAAAQETTGAPLSNVPQVTHLTAAQLGALNAALPPHGPSTHDLVKNKGYSVATGQLRRRDGRPELHRTAARVFLITHGRGKMRIGGRIAEAAGSIAADVIATNASRYTGYRTIALRKGSLVHVRPGVPYQLVAGTTEFTFVVVRIRA